MGGTWTHKQTHAQREREGEGGEREREREREGEYICLATRRVRCPCNPRSNLDMSLHLSLAGGALLLVTHIVLQAVDHPCGVRLFCEIESTHV